MARLIMAWCPVCGWIEEMKVVVTVNWAGLQCTLCGTDNETPFVGERKVA